MGVMRMRSDAERIAVLETKFETMQEDIGNISLKLDELLELKSKGLGAFWLVGLIFGSGILGIIVAAFSFFKPGHL